MKTKQSDEMLTRYITAVVGRILDEPRVELDTVRRAEPDILVGHPKPLRSDGVGARQSGQHGHVDKLLLERHQRRHPHDGDAPGAIGERLQPSGHPGRIQTRLRVGCSVPPPCVFLSSPPSRDWPIGADCIFF